MSAESINIRNIAGDFLGAIGSSYVFLGGDLMSKSTISAIYLASHFIFDKIKYLIPGLGQSWWMDLIIEVVGVGVLFYYGADWLGYSIGGKEEVAKYVLGAVLASDFVTPMIGGSASQYLSVKM